MRYLLLLFFFFFFSGMYAQTHKIDVLKERINGAKDEREQLRYLLVLCEEHETLFKDSLMSYVLRTKDIALRLHDKSAIGYSNIAMGNAYLRLDEVDSAMAIVVSESVKYPVADKATRGVHFGLANIKVNCYAGRSDYENAVKEIYGIISEAEEYRDSLVLARCCNTLGVISYNRNELGNSLNWYHKALAYSSGNDIRYDPAKAFTYINLAQTYGWLEKFDTATWYINKAFPVCERIENLYYLANAYMIRADIYKWSKQVGRAMEPMLKAIEIRQRTEGDIVFSNEQLGLANLYMHSGEYDKARKIYLDGLAYIQQRKSENRAGNINYDVLLNYYMGLARCYKFTGDHNRYEQVLERLLEIKDTLYATNSTRAITEMQTKYEVQKKENTIIQQRLNITSKNVLLYGSLSLVLLGLIIAWLLFRNYSRRQKMKLFIVQEEEKRNALQAVRDAEERERKRIAADLHDNLGSYAASIAANIDEVSKHFGEEGRAMSELKSNSSAIVAQLGDTIWALKKDELSLTEISDRIKVFLHRIQPSYPVISMEVFEELEEDVKLSPSQAFHLFSIMQEAVNNALRHSGCDSITITITMKSSSTWEIQIADNGQGMGQGVPKTEGGNGIYNMRMRASASSCSIYWSERGGTLVTIAPTTN